MSGASYNWSSLFANELDSIHKFSKIHASTRTPVMSSGRFSDCQCGERRANLVSNERLESSSPHALGEKSQADSAETVAMMNS